MACGFLRFQQQQWKVVCQVWCPGTTHTRQSCMFLVCTSWRRFLAGSQRWGQSPQFQVPDTWGQDGELSLARAGGLCRAPEEELRSRRWKGRREEGEAWWRRRPVEAAPGVSTRQLLSPSSMIPPQGPTPPQGPKPLKRLQTGLGSGGWDEIYKWALRHRLKGAACQLRLTPFTSSPGPSSC